MALGRSSAVVLGSFPLGESDRVVTFFARQHGRLRGVARHARRPRSRFGAALEPFTVGELIFFDGGRSELVRVDHFDITRPFTGVREDLERCGEAAWMAECVARLTAERDPHVGLYALLVRALAALEAGAAPAQVAVVFGLRCVGALGYRLRLEACVACGRSLRGAAGAALDLAGGGVVCAACAAGGAGDLAVGPAVLHALRRLRACAWEEALMPVPAAPDLRAIIDTHVASLIGQPARASRFLREVRKHWGGAR